MKDKLVTARRTVTLPFIDDGRYHELTSGKRSPVPKIAKSPWAFACMNIRGQELANFPWHIKRGDKVLENHPLQVMLADFGPESNYQRAMLYTEMDMLIYGAALWLRDVDILKRLDPATIEVKMDANGITGFKQTIELPDGTTAVNYFAREEIVYFREFHTDNDLDFGISAAEVCKRLVSAEVEALQMIEALYKNDAVPGLFLSSDQDITEKEANRLLNWWNRRFRGGRNKGKVGVAGKGLKPTPVGSNMKDAMVMELLDSVHDDICVAFRVPKPLVGSQMDATYLNLNESRKFMIEDVLIPRAIEFQNVINQDLIPYVDPNVEFEFAFDELKILQEDSTEKHLRLFQAVQAGIIKEDFYREQMGYPDDAKPDDAERQEKVAKQEIAESKWQKKAVKALLRGDDPDVDFETDNIAIDRQYVIHGRLKNAKTADAVRACFD